ncbi:DegQ family serine endoprotease [Marinomonas sp. M1K-6]|uniref:Probable periplasmic serine endoprotease DegP-like n=1 Tax=Marinomonas profundi TaxID=2726122 RepID=A0A847R4M1_9GAMM|nr:DegQ family serine endoprotease [Marinomonas profundi]NLQ18941.1 DegQ family serine endoprotease [Marinomonas profundi]UDV02320.1 DegQ family serine endoprotease [Marinomonas profundi]
MNRLLKQASMVVVSTFMMASMLSHAAALPDFTELVEEASPAVVNISTEQKIVAKAANENQPQLGPNSEELNEFFKHFFGQQPFGQQAPPPQGQRSSLGSGFIVSHDGYVLTNNHVIDGADVIHVRLNDRREYVATLVGTDPRTDLALLKIEATDLPIVKMADSDKLKPGQWVLAIGSPFGFDYTVTAGIVSATGRNLPSDNYVPFIQTDVAINPGNSGGPLFNLDGEVVGINSQIYTRSGGFMGVSFAIPSKVAMSVVEQLKKDGKVSRAWLGVLIQDVNNELAESFGLDRSNGALISRVLPDSPAEKAGLQSGDIILEFNGQSIAHSGELPYVVGQMKAGDKVDATVYREGKEQNISVMLEARPNDSETLAQSQQDQSRFGMVVGDLPAEIAKRFDIESGVIIEQIIGGAAARNGLQQGDVITMLNGKPIDNVTSFNEAAKAVPNGRSVPMRVIRQGYPMFIPFKIVE